ncbi:hypothetical protein P7B04_16685 [Sphingobium yanoikuyae]|uniref:hypothetical protein n=1 Tax=Sphingobium yanoikuyae TaxID=13690 RepID=UPI000847B109|nr:hypothetical protein [Sphingobium yanoikuyae]MDG2514331.1 hypothetical protein [Sphingobium yanoikuyae]
MTHDARHAVVSHERIYRFVYAQIQRTQDFSWRLYLARGKSKRGWRRKPGGSPANFITGRKPLCERPGEADDRCTPGHWDADAMLFATYGQAILVAHERQSCLTLVVKMKDRKATTTARTLRALLAPIHQHGTTG